MPYRITMSSRGTAGTFSLGSPRASFKMDGGPCSGQCVQGIPGILVSCLQGRLETLAAR